MTITAGGTELVDTTTANLSKAFSSRQVVELAQTTAGPAGSAAGVNNLALLAAGVTSSGGVGVGTGGSVGGQRPRDNNFIVDGVDNNDKSVTGPQSYISPEEVAEFTLLQNQFSAEFARSNGGNFLTVTKTGTNEFHGTFYGFFRNRYLNAIDTIQKSQGVNRDRQSENFMGRSDYFRGGYNLGGPVFSATGRRWPVSLESKRQAVLLHFVREIRPAVRFRPAASLRRRQRTRNHRRRTGTFGEQQAGVFQFMPVAAVADVQSAA